MSEHFRAFSFVDHISAVQPGGSVRGSYVIPKSLSDFSSSLVAEAAGQLAAWAAMAAVDFKARPVAGIAGLVEMLAPVQPGQVLELAADIESVDDAAIGYQASVSVQGRPVLRLHDCVGPMLPVEEFDDPQALRDRYALICGNGATAGAFPGVSPFSLENLSGDAGETLKANLQVPVDAPFFEDHFPRKPVFPGSLLMQCKLQLVGELVASLPPPAPGRSWKIQSVVDMKLRAFLPPGEALELEAKFLGVENEVATVSVASRRAGKAAGSARVTLVPEN
jgi:3-hydroxymyristoyl/3-hydroxydecanoyl-(acyl carrier protein) dehydratase